MLATPPIIGTPPLVLVVFAVMLLLTVAMWRHLERLIVPVSDFGTAASTEEQANAA